MNLYPERILAEVEKRRAASPSWPVSMRFGLSRRFRLAGCRYFQLGICLVHLPARWHRNEITCLLTGIFLDPGVRRGADRHKDYGRLSGGRDKVIEQFDGGTLHDITYASPKGGPVDAYLLVPTGNGPFAAILFGHWGNGTRAEFIPEAKIYARAGAASLIPDYPWDRPAPWHKTPDHFDKPDIDREIYLQAVVDLRRGIDLLLARPDVDPKQLAYIGHSYGAQWARFSLPWISE
jgi:hypothetical protein